MKRRGLVLVVSLGALGCILVILAIPRVREVGAFFGAKREGVAVVDPSDTGCEMPPEAFTESDLIGTWVAGTDGREDTLILSDDGLYRQQIEIREPRFSYESDWQPYWIESGKNVPSRLHLEGMRLCVYSLSSNCPEPPEEDHWYDYCSEQVVETHSEGVLLIVGVPPRFEQPPRGIELVPLSKDPDTGGWPYQLTPIE